MLKVLLGVGELVVVGSVPTLKLGTHLKLSMVVISSSSEFSLKFSSVTVVGASVVVVVVVVVVLVVLAIGSERTSRRTDPGIGLRLTTLLAGGRVTRGACVVLVVEGSVVISSTSGSKVVASSMVVVVGASVVVEVEVTGDDSSKSLSRLLIVFGELLCLAPVCVKFAH